MCESYDALNSFCLIPEIYYKIYNDPDDFYKKILNEYIPFNFENDSDYNLIA